MKYNEKNTIKMFCLKITIKDLLIVISNNIQRQIRFVLSVIRSFGEKMKHNGSVI